MTSARSTAFAVYVVLSLVGHLAWEVAQLRLYTIWREAPFGELAFAVVHCTAGDGLIAAATLLIALVLVGARRWPSSGFRTVAAVTIFLGVAYTGFSEWLNVYVRGSWSYAVQMPTVHVGGYAVGLAPLLQWIAVPLVVFAILAGRLRRPSGPSPTAMERDRTV